MSRPFVLCVLVSLSCLHAIAQETAPGLVTARVCDQHGKPIAGAGVLYAPSHAWTSAALWTSPQARSDEHGNVRLEVAAVDDRERRVLLVGAPGTMVAAVALPDAGGRRFRAGLDLGTIHLFAGATLHGRVRDEGGRPIAGVRVQADDPSPAWGTFANADVPLAWSTATMTDDNGVYSLAGAAPRTVRVTFTKPGFRSLARFPVRVDTPVDVRMERSGFVRGRIEGAGAARAWITASYELGCPAPLPSTAAADGSFELPICGHGRFRIHVGVPHPGTGARSDPLDGPRDGLVLRLPETSALRVRVSAGGTPVPEFSVVAWPREVQQVWMPAFFPSPPLRFAGRDGAADVEIRPTDQPLELRIHAQGFAPHAFTVPATDRAFACELTQREAVCAGRVVDATTRRPLAGARVFVLTAKDGENATFNPHAGAIVTGADGAFRIGGLPGGSLALQVDHAAHAVPEPILFEVEAGDAHPFGDLALEPLPRLRGRIAGAPLPDGASLGEVDSTNLHVGTWKGLRYTPHRRLREVPVARDGTFDLGPADVEPTELQILLAPKRHCGMRLSVALGTVTPDGQAIEFAAPHPLACTIEGQVRVDEAVLDVAALRVVAVRSTGPHGLLHSVVASSDLDLRSRFQLQLAPGSYHVAIVDLATGRAVHVRDEALVVEKGEERLPLDVDVPLQRVAFAFEPAEAGGVVAVSQLRTFPHEERRVPPWLSRCVSPSYQIPVPPGARDHVLALVPGTWTVHAALAVDAIADRPDAAGDGLLGDATFVVGDEACRVTLRLAEPPTDDPPRGR